MEIWKVIEGYENYEVSSCGNVRSLITGKILKQRFQGNYKFVTLYRYGLCKHFYIHRLVAQAFLDNPDNLPCVNHKNENKMDNRAENLEFCTHEYNMRYSRNWEKSNEVTRKTVLQFTKSGEFVDEYESVAEAGRQTGIYHSSISSCCAGKRKSAGNYKWKYKTDV